MIGWSVTVLSWDSIRFKDLNIVNRKGLMSTWVTVGQQPADSMFGHNVWKNDLPPPVGCHCILGFQQEAGEPQLQEQRADVTTTTSSASCFPHPVIHTWSSYLHLPSSYTQQSKRVNCLHFHCSILSLIRGYPTKFSLDSKMCSLLFFLDSFLA